MPSPGARRLEWLSVHAAPPELCSHTAPLQWQGWTFSRTRPGHLHRCTQDAALSSKNLIMWLLFFMKALSNASRKWRFFIFFTQHSVCCLFFCMFVFFYLKYSFNYNMNSVEIYFSKEHHFITVGLNTKCHMTPVVAPSCVVEQFKMWVQETGCISKYQRPGSICSKTGEKASKWSLTAKNPNTWQSNHRVIVVINNHVNIPADVFWSFCDFRQ